MNLLVKKNLVIGLSKVEFTKDGLCDACQKGKQRKASFKSNTESSIDELLGPNIGEGGVEYDISNLFIFVLADYKFTFLKTKLKRFGEIYCI